MIEEFLMNNADTGLIGAVLVWTLIKTGAQTDRFIEEISSFKEVTRKSTETTEKCILLLNDINIKNKTEH